MSTKKETERSKLMQEKCQTLITAMLKDEDNKYCVDCDAKGPRWASWNLGVFLCIRCAGIHRNLGVHITRVKSVNLDTWTPEQVASLQHMGNSRARAVYEAQLPDGFRRPQTDAALESFIRAKYEQKKYVAKEWVPSPAPKVDWEKEIDEELEKQKRKKKSLAAAGGGSAILGSTLSSPSVDKKTPAVSKPTPIPAPLPKPKSSGHSPKTGRPQLELSNASAVLSSPSNGAAGHSSNTLDLLGLSSPPAANTSSSSATNNSKDQSNGGGASDDEFNNFFSANSQSRQQLAADATKKVSAVAAEKPRSLAQEEADFFNQSVPSDAEKAKLTKDSIMALYASLPVQAAPVPVAAVATQPGNPTSNVNLLAGLGAGPGFPGQMGPQQINGGFPTQQQSQKNGMNHFGGLGMVPQQQQQQPMFGGGQFGGAGNQMQQPPTQIPSQFMNGGGGGFYHNGNGGGIMGQAQTQQKQQGMNFFPANGMGGFQQAAAAGVNPMMVPGGVKGGFTLGGPGQQPQPPMMGGVLGNGNGAPQFPFLGGMPGGAQQQQQQQMMVAAGSANGGAGQATTMQNQFGNLNLGNVWQ